MKVSKTESEGFWEDTSNSIKNRYDSIKTSQRPEEKNFFALKIIDKVILKSKR